MARRSSPRIAAGVAVGAALVVVAIWWRRPRTPAVESAVDATVAVRVSRHDALGMSPPPTSVRDRARVRAIVEALGIDAHPVVPCPPDYASAELGLLLSGRDVYARRNVYVWHLFDASPVEGAEAGAASPGNGAEAGAASPGNGAEAPGDGGARAAPVVVVVSSSGCRGGRPSDAARLRALLSSDERDASRQDRGL
ncbi:MAG: hypothetical protein KF782_29225 [Labilithrix sp.]|nr:hypothetical protein [Labilithrix sp.]